jgi:hypothetical protein
LSLSLVAAGDAPRAKVRYRAADTKGRLALLKFRMTSAAGRQIALAVMLRTLAIEPLAPDQLRWKFRLERADLPGEDAAAGASLDGVTGSVRFTALGAIEEVELGREDDRLKLVRAMFNLLIIPVPDTAVGKGAIWQATSSVHAAVPAEDLYRYELLAREGNRVRVRLSLSQKASADAKPSSFESEGHGAVDLDLDGPMMRNASLTSTINLSTPAGGGRARMELSVEAR